MEGGFIPYTRIGGLAWREDAEIVLVVVPRRRASVRRLVVPRDAYAEARRILRDKIAQHEIHYAGETLDLGGHDERRDV
jgi:transposase-like protein